MSFQLVALPCPGIAQLLAVVVPSVAQKEAVLGILVQWKGSFAEEVDENVSGSSTALLEYVHPVQQACIAVPLQQQWSGTVLGSLFYGLSNCSVNISPQKFVVNLNPPSVPYAPDVDSLWDGIELKDLM